MKYWILTTEFPPIHGGGISTYCYHTAKMLSLGGDELTIFIYDHSVKDYIIEADSKDYKLVRFNPDRGQLSKKLGFDARLSFEYAAIVEEFIEKEGRPDYIETQDYLGIGYYLQQKSWMNYPNLRGIPIAVCMHAPAFLYLEYNQSPLYKLPGYWTGEMEKASIAMADLLLSPSQYLIDILKEKLDTSMDMAVNLFNPYEINEEAAIDFTEGELVFFGKLTPQKGCLELFENLKSMWDKGFDKSIRIIGGGAHFFYSEQMDMLEFLQKKYQKYIQKGLFHFEGNVSPQYLHRYLKSAHIIIVPSIVDNLPYAVIEAMAMGKMLLVSDSGGQKELIESGENGFVFSHEKKDFSEKLTQALKLSKSQVLEMGKRARKTVEEQLNYQLIYDKKRLHLKSIKNRNKLFPFSRKSLNTDKLLSLSANSKLSIVIPYYNLSLTIEESLKSLQNVEYKNVELIVVNDGSTEKDSKEILENLQKQYNFILLHKENSGLSESRNFGAKYSSGDYLAFLDADDTVEITYYSKAIELLSSYDNLHFVGCWAQFFGESNEVWPAFNPEPPYLLYHNMINSSALVYKKEFFLKFGLNKKQMIYGMEDYESVINMVKNGARGVALPEALWNYRIRKNSMQQSFNKNKQLYLYNQIAELHKEFFNMYGAELSKLFNHNGAGYKMENPTIGEVKSNIFLDAIPQSFKNRIKKNDGLRNLAKSIYRKLNN